MVCEKVAAIIVADAASSTNLDLNMDARRGQRSACGTDLHVFEPQPEIPNVKKFVRTEFKSAKGAGQMIFVGHPFAALPGASVPTGFAKQTQSSILVRHQGSVPQCTPMPS